MLRTVALTRHYGAPMHVLDALPERPGRLCYAKEWYRFPSHFFVHNSTDVQFARSAFTGILPHKFGSGKQHAVSGNEARVLGALERVLRWPWPETRTVPARVNEFNRDEPDRYVPISTCDFLVDSDIGAATPEEPRRGDEWTPLLCAPFLDAEASRIAAHTMPLKERIVATAARTLWLPEMVSQHLTGAQSLQYGSYCLYRHS